MNDRDLKIFSLGMIAGFAALIFTGFLAKLCADFLFMILH